MTNIHHTKRLLIAVFTLLLTFILAPNTSAKIDTADVAPVTDNRWVISEFYPGSDADYDDAYLEIYNNTDKRTVGYKDFVINLPFNLELPPVYDIHNYKPHAYKKLSLDEGWNGWLVKSYLQTMYGEEFFTEVEDALNETDGYSYERCQISEGKPELSEEFYYGKKTPGKRILCSDKTISKAPSGIVGEDGDNVDAHQCQSLRLNEIYANTDDKQFIEIKNSGEADIDLGRCYLSKSKDENDDMVALADGEAMLGAGELTSVDPVILGLDNLNFTRGVVYLVDTDRQTVVDYKRYMTPKKETAAALDDKGEWQITYQPTPDATNVIAGEPCPTGQTRNHETNRCVKDDQDKGSSKEDAGKNSGTKNDSKTKSDGKDNSAKKSDTTNKTCPEGKYYYAPTKRCRKIPVDESETTSDTAKAASTAESNKASESSSLALRPCRDGYERNPETNRCRKITSASDDSSSGLTPCASGYERNPDTNRCAKIKSTTTTESGSGSRSSSNSSSFSKALAPCKDGYERNPSTNRCVKKKAASSTSLKPCKEGYERNPETNRCRKKASSSGGSKASGSDDAKFPVTSTRSTKGSGNGTTNTTGLLVILGVIGGLSAIILVWQYRAEIGRFYRKITGQEPAQP